MIILDSKALLAMAANDIFFKKKTFSCQCGRSPYLNEENMTWNRSLSSRAHPKPTEGSFSWVFVDELFRSVLSIVMTMQAWRHGGLMVISITQLVD